MNVREIVEGMGLKIDRDDGAEYALFCPFHHNTDSPAFSINKTTGLWQCFNPQCGKKGNLKGLARELGLSKNVELIPETEDILLSLKDSEPIKDEGWDDALEKIKINYDDPRDIQKLTYLKKRGFSWGTLKTFEVAYSESKQRIVIPCRDENWKVLGFIGRAVGDGQPKYLYSKNFPRKSVLFNLNRAKRESDVVVCEGSLDAMRIHQAGFHGVVATLGANVTDEHLRLLGDYFQKVYIFPDMDDAGVGMTNRIVSGLTSSEVLIAQYPPKYVEQHEEKGDKFDPGALSDDEIVWGLENSVDGFSYMFNNLFAM